MFEKKISDEERKKMEREAKKAYKASKKEGKGSGIKDKILSVCKVVVLPLIFAGIIVCAIYLAMQNKLEAESLKGQVLVMKENVAENTFVKADEADKYFRKLLYR